MTNNDLHNTTQKTKENYRSSNMNHRYFVLLYIKNNHRHLLISLYDWNHSQCNFGIDICLLIYSVNEGSQYLQTIPIPYHKLFYSMSNSK